MALFDFLKPKWKRSNPQARIAGLGELEDEQLLADLAAADPDESVRKAALQRLDQLRPRWQHSQPEVRRQAVAALNQKSLEKLASSDPDESVRKAALQRLDEVRPKWLHSQPEVRRQAVASLNLDDQETLKKLAGSDPDESVRRAALQRLDEVRPKWQHSQPDVRRQAVASLNLDDQEALKKLTSSDPDTSVRRAAFERLTLLRLEAFNNLSPSVRMAKQEELRDACRSLASLSTTEMALHPLFLSPSPLDSIQNLLDEGTDGASALPHLREAASQQRDISIQVVRDLYELTKAANPHLVGQLVAEDPTAADPRSLRKNMNHFVACNKKAIENTIRSIEAQAGIGSRTPRPEQHHPADDKSGEPTMSACDVCGKHNALARGEGYCLTTRQVVTEPAYWAQAFRAWKLGAPMGNQQLFAMLLKRQCSQSTGWMACDDCIKLFGKVSYEETKRCAAEFWKTEDGDYAPPGCGAVDRSTALSAAKAGWREADGQ